MTLSPARIVLLLGAVAIVASLATLLTIGGVVVYAAMRPTPTHAPAYRAPVAPAYVAPQRSSDPLGDWQREREQQQKEACDRQWRQYQIDYADYTARKAQGGSFAFAPMRPLC